MFVVVVGAPAIPRLGAYLGACVRAFLVVRAWVRVRACVRAFLVVRAWVRACVRARASVPACLRACVRACVPVRPLIAPSTSSLEQHPVPLFQCVAV